MSREFRDAVRNTLLVFLEAQSVRYKRHGFPPEIITHAIGLFRFPLSVRLAEEVLLERGLIASYGTVRQWRWSSGQHTLAVSGARQPMK